MIVINKQQFIVDMNAYADNYARQLTTGMYKTVCLVDASYAREIVTGLGTFAALISHECLTDTMLFHNEQKFANDIKDGYESFGDYCYDMLKQAFDKTNLTLVKNNELANALISKANVSDMNIAVATNYIGFNNLSNGCKLELTNFTSLQGHGLCYDIALRQNPVNTTNVQEQFRGQLDAYVSMAEIVRQLKDSAEFNELIETWSAEVNEVLLEAKTNAKAAWNAMYQINKKDWFNVSFRKQNRGIYCELTLTPKKITEILVFERNKRTYDYGLDFMKVLELDYINLNNFEFR